MASATPPLFKDYVYKMQQDRFKVFKSQDQENGEFDVKFIIEGKTIYAHKFILKPVSETLNAMLSNRWSNKDEPIKIETYTYDNFYRFLGFIYIGSCKLTNESIREMVDIAEFYGVTCFKDFCDRFFAAHEFVTQENIEELYDFAQQYSLPLFTQSIKKFINSYGNVVILENDFTSFKKPFIKFFAVALDGNFKEEFFEAAYKWVEHHVLENATTMNDENFNLQEAIKTEARAHFAAGSRGLSTKWS